MRQTNVNFLPPLYEHVRLPSKSVEQLVRLRREGIINRQTQQNMRSTIGSAIPFEPERRGLGFLMIREKWEHLLHLEAVWHFHPPNDRAHRICLVRLSPDKSGENRATTWMRGRPQREHDRRWPQLWQGMDHRR